MILLHHVLHSQFCANIQTCNRLISEESDRRIDLPSIPITSPTHRKLAPPEIAKSINLISESERAAKIKRKGGKQPEAPTLSLQERHEILSKRSRTLTAAQNADLLRRGFFQFEIDGCLDRGWLWKERGGYGIAAIDPRTGLTVGAQLAKDDRKPKYPWLLRGQTHLLETGQNPLACWISPDFDYSKSPKVHLCEGFLKSLLAAIKAWRHDPQIIFVGAAGHSFGEQALLRVLDALGDCDSVTLCPDGGSVKNKGIVNNYLKALGFAQSWGFSTSILWWEQSEKAKNDVDEIDPQTFFSAKNLSIAEFEAVVDDFSPSQNWLERISQVLKGRPKPIDSTLALRRELGEVDTQIFEYSESDRLGTWKQASEQGYRAILDLSPTGTGKSHDSGTATPADFGAERLFYVSNDRRNSTAPTLAEWQEVEARHNGLTIDPAGKLRRRKDGQAATVAANCARTEAIRILRSKNIQGADGDTVCQTCPVLNACKFSSGKGYGFKFQRRQALSADRLRIHPASLPDPSEDFSYAKTVNIWDEASSSIQNSRSIAVSVADLDQLISQFACQAPQQFTQLQPLLSRLRALLTGDQPRYGFSYHDVLKALPELDFSTLDWDSLIQVLQPNLSGLKPPDEIDLGQLAPKERRGLGLVKRALIRETAQSQSEQAEILKQTVLKQWLNEFLGVLNGGTDDLRINRGELTLTISDNRHRAVIEASKLNIFLDATLTRKDAALKLGCRPDEIFVCRQRLPQVKNLTITQITDLGKLTQQRGEDKQRRATAIAIHYQAQDPTTKVIDFKKFETDGAWWRDSRGVNDFLKVKTLLLVGTPIANIAYLLSEYSILTGTHPTEEDLGFQAYVDRTIRAEFYQAIGRLRANRRPDEQLQAIILSNFDLGIPTNKVKASQITLEAADKWERFEMAFKAAANQLKANGEKLTQTAIAKLTDYSQQYLSRFWKLLLSLLETPYRESSKNSDPPPPLIKSVAEGIDAAINQFCDTPDQVAQTINEAFFEWLESDQWSQVWQNLQTQTQIRILESLALTLPADELRELEAIV